VSLFAILEKIQSLTLPDPKEIQGPVVLLYQPFVLMATWMAESGDTPDVEFEYELRAIVPAAQPVPGLVAGQAIVGLAAGTFRFETPIHRFTAPFEQPVPVGLSGTLWFESRIRKKGVEEWLSQAYPILVEIAPAPKQGLQ
jgi:hypothetical protein